MKRIVLLLVSLVLITGCSGAYTVGDVLMGGNHIYISPYQLHSDDTPYEKEITLRWYEDVGDYKLAGKPAGPIIANTYDYDMEVQVSYNQPGYTYNGYVPAPDGFQYNIVFDGWEPPEQWDQYYSANITVKSGKIVCLPVKFKTTKDLPDKFWFDIRLYPKKQIPREGPGGIALYGDVIVHVMVTMAKE